MKRDAEGFFERRRGVEERSKEWIERGREKQRRIES
jgi:hypothetical protein